MVRATGKGVVRDLLKQVGEVPGGGYKPESGGRRLPPLFFFPLHAAPTVTRPHHPKRQCRKLGESAVADRMSSIEPIREIIGCPGNPWLYAGVAFLYPKNTNIPNDKDC
jgi:hypothetical protein